MIKTTDIYPTKTTVLFIRFLGGQFEPESGGQFEMAEGGQFPVAGGGQFAWIFQISYQPFENEMPFKLIIHPYFLKQYNNRWFLFGYNPEKEKYDWNLALDRIKEITEKKGKYQKNNLIKWEEYFEDIIGVTIPIDTKPEKIVLHFAGRTGNYIETKPLHGSQKSKWLDDTTLEVTLQIIINYELERLILSYADSVAVIQPKTLSNAIRNRLKEALKLYK